MPQYTNKQIFFDQSQLRWRYLKPFFTFLGIFLAVIFGTMFFTFFRKPFLPKPNMEIPTSQLRSAPISSAADKNLQKLNKNMSFNINVLHSTFSASANQAYTVSQNSNYLPKIIGYYVNWDDTSFTSLQKNIHNLDQLIPEWLHLGDENGNIIIDDQIVQENTINLISQIRPGLSIVPLINNFDQNQQNWNSDILDKMLKNPQARSQNIQNLLDFVKKNKFSGISINYENVPLEDQPLLEEYMKELYAKFHPLGLEVTQNIPLEDSSFNTKVLSQYSDYLILMAYDENSIGNSHAGPIASHKWFIESLKKRLNEIPPQKYIVALGNYGYDWKANSTDGQTYTFQEAMLSAKDSNTQINLDSKSLNPTYNYYDGETLHNVWFLDAVTVFNEISAIKKIPFRGYALWRLGSEDPSVWKILQNPTRIDASTASSLIKLTYGYDINYEGNGEILRVTGTPQSGSRNITYDKSADLIIQENILKYPDAYTVYCWGGTNPKKIALTFDDGPDPNYTPKIISILKKYNVPATFFVIGANGTQNQNILKQEIAYGNEIGNHTFTHPNITSISDTQLSLELNSTESLLASIIGRHTLLFRPPYAEDIEPVTPDQIRSVFFASNQGYFTVGMHIDPSDWNSPGTDEIINRVINGAENGDGNIVLLHDGGGDRLQTVEALPKIIEGLRSRGFELVTVSELMGLPQESVMPPITSKTQAISAISEGAFLATDWGTASLYIFFVMGIILGILRFIFIAVLATTQKIKHYFETFPRYIEKFKPSVAVIIPAYNEEQVIRKTIDVVLASTYPNLEIIVVDDGSTDNTLNVLHYFFHDNPKVKIFSKSNEGKWSALNFGIEKTSAQIIVTLDADTLFRPSTIEKMLPYFSDLRVGAVAGNTKVGNRKNLLTRWQALEYITSQNLDRRAFDVINCVTVVPGSVGAWRRKAVIEAGGFSGCTMAEDADLTFSIIRLGYKVIFQPQAIAYTEAPENVKDFLKQRFRWMYGTLQTTWKHFDTIFHPKYGALGIFAIPNILIFQIFFLLIAPLMDLFIILSLAWAGWQYFHHPVDYSAFFTLEKLAKYYLIFLALDFLTSATAFALEKSEDWKLLFWLIPQRFLYRQLMYYVALKVFAAALKGKIVGWGKLRRRATVSLEAF